MNGAGGGRTVPKNIEVNMSTQSPSHPEHAFRGFDHSVERLVGTDMRLIYGLWVPILMVIGPIVILALSPAVWLVASILVLEIAALAVVIYGFTGMLREPEYDDTEPS